MLGNIAQWGLTAFVTDLCYEVDVSANGRPVSE
jgi:hypothetical protein